MPCPVQASFKVENTLNPRKLTTAVGCFDDSFMEFSVDGDHQHGWSIHWGEASGTVQFRHARLDARVPLKLTTQLTTYTDENLVVLPPGQIVMQGVWVKVSGNKYRFIDLGQLEERVAALEAA